MTLQIEEGKYYKGTDGQKYGPMLHEGVGELNHPWYQEGSGLIWFSDGTSSFEPHLVAEWEDTEDMTEDTPKFWKDMTDEEKGTLLLAHHEGKTIEWNGTNAISGKWTGWETCDEDCLWDGSFDKVGFAYRVKPAPKEPKRETVTVGWDGGSAQEGLSIVDTHKITFDLIDGVPDCDSIKMEEI